MVVVARLYVLCGDVCGDCVSVVRCGGGDLWSGVCVCLYCVECGSGVIFVFFFFSCVCLCVCLCVCKKKKYYI